VQDAVNINKARAVMLNPANKYRRQIVFNEFVIDTSDVVFEDFFFNYRKLCKKTLDFESRVDLSAIQAEANIRFSKASQAAVLR
jgi:hypothetical protein